MGQTPGLEAPWLIKDYLTDPVANDPRAAVWNPANPKFRPPF